MAATFQDGDFMRILRYLLWFIKLLVFILLFAFAMQNAERITVHFLLDYVWQAPMALVILAFFMLGALMGILAMLGRIIVLRRELIALRREVRQRNTDMPVQPPRDAL
jgi:uncharacterized integral membrane protein